MILDKLATDNKWVERALLVLTERQVPIERQIKATVFHNEKGFQPADARYFTIFAERIRAKMAEGVPEGECLSEGQIAYCRRPWHRGRRPIPTIGKYRGQLLKIIEAKAKARISK